MLLRVLVISVIPWSPSNRGIDVMTEFFVEKGFEVTHIVFPFYPFHKSKFARFINNTTTPSNLTQAFSSTWVIPYSANKMYWIPKPIKKVIYLSHVKSLTRVLDLNKYDIIVVESGKAVMLHNVLPKKSFVIYRQSDPVWLLVEKDKELIKLEQRIFERADLILTIRNDEEFDRVPSQFRYKIEVWKNGFNIPKEYIDVNPYSEDDKRKGVYVGYSPIDSVTLDEIASKHRDVEFHIIGNCLSWKELRRLLNKNDNLTFHGNMPPNEYIRYVKYADFAIVPYANKPILKYVGLNGKFLLFMFFGLPIVSYETKFIKDGYLSILTAKSAEEFSEKVNIAKKMGRIIYDIDWDYYSSSGRKKELSGILRKYLDI